MTLALAPGSPFVFSRLYKPYQIVTVLFLQSAMSNSSHSSPPRASLSTLPNEIKAQIVALVNSQDKEWQESDVSEEASERHVKGVNALSATCKEMNTLAAKHIFEVRWLLRAA